MNLPQSVAVSVLIAVVALPATAAISQEPRSPVLHSSHQTRPHTGRITYEYQCDQAATELDVEVDVQGSPRVTRLELGGSESAQGLSQINEALRGLGQFRQLEVECTGTGLSVTLFGSFRRVPTDADANAGSVTLMWAGSETNDIFVRTIGRPEH